MNSLFVTYEDISDCWPTFKHNIEGFFPLRNVHKPKLLGVNENNTLIRNIPIINLKFIPLKAETLALKSIMNLNERPYLHIFIGFCEDIDVYRQQFRPRLKAWLESISTRKNNQFMVILIENQSNINEYNKSGKTFLLDKIRFDFSDKVALKLISLKLLPGENLNFIPECIDLISDCVYQSAVMNLSQLDEDIRTLASQQNIAGWNFFTFFQTKECKALILTDLGLISEAIACYDELETLFLEIDSSTSPVSFKNILPAERSITGSDLSFSNCVKYREMINQNQISRYEFQTYLLSRQINLLRDMKDNIQILKRTKEYVCRTIALKEIDDCAKAKWISDTFFHVLKIIDIDSVQIQANSELSNILADVLFIASSQKNLVIGAEVDKSSIEQLLDLTQIIEYSDSSHLEQMIQFKLSTMRYCLGILKTPNCMHKKVIISLKLSDVYYELKMYNVALEIIQDASEQIQGLNWPAIQLLLTRKGSDCYWNLNMAREYLREVFELIQIPGSSQLITEIDKDKVKKAAHSLEDKLSLKFENFFRIDSVFIKHTSDDRIKLHSVITSNYDLPVENCELFITLYGEKEDIVFSASTVKIQKKNDIVADLSVKEERPSGNHRIKSISLIFGNLRFESDNMSNIWNHDINLMESENLFIEASVPLQFDFGDPSIIIRYRNKNDYDIENLTLSCSSSDLGLRIDPDSSTKDCEIENGTGNKITLRKLPSKSDFEIKFKVSRYVHGRHGIKAISSFDYNDKSKSNLVSKINIELPELWMANRFSIKCKSLDLEQTEILPAASRESASNNIKFLGSNETKNDFNFEIGPKTEGVSIVCSPHSKRDEIKLKYSEIDGAIRSFSIPLKALENQMLLCTIIPSKTTVEDIVLGTIVNFEIRIEGNVSFEHIPFSLLYDVNHWLLSGSSNGFSKASWFFDMVAIKKGLIQIPSIKFTTSIPVHIFSYGSTVFVRGL